MTFLRTLGNIIILIIVASLLVSILNTVRAEYTLVCYGNRVITDTLFRSNFERAP